MNMFSNKSKALTWLMALALAGVMAGCGGGGGGGGSDGGGSSGGAGPFSPAAIVPGATCTTAGPLIPRVLSSDPTSGNLLVSTSTGAIGDPKQITATFSMAMNPLTIDSAAPGTLPTFTIKNNTTAGSIVSGTVLLNAAGTVATFTTTAALPANNSFTATITTFAKSAAVTNDALGCPVAWNFSTTLAASAGQAPVDLRSLSTFVAVAGAGLTNSNSGGVTTLNGDVGLSPTATCLGDGIPCVAGNPVINGTLFANDPGGVAAQAKTDLIAASVDASTRPPGTTVNDITGLVLIPGVYTSGSTMSIAVGGTVTLDPQGDADAVWIFQIGSSLTVNNGATVNILAPGKANNVYWAIFASSTIGSGADFKGNVLAGASNSVGTGSTVLGRLLCTTGQITLLSNTITLPTP